MMHPHDGHNKEEQGDHHVHHHHPHETPISHFHRHLEDSEQILVELNDDEFNAIKKHLIMRAGIVVDKDKKQMIQNKLTKFFRTNPKVDREEYLTNVIHNHDKTIQHLIELLTINFTYFFRGHDHFDFLKDKLKEKYPYGVNIWSAGCSAGQEPYTIAIILAEEKLLDKSRIFASDLSTDMLGIAKRGIYPIEETKKISKELLKKYFSRGKEQLENLVRANDVLKKQVQFVRINLVENWLIDYKFDFIFCRNVFIYFDDNTKTQILKKFHNQLKPNGYLIIGHSESIVESDLYEAIGKNIYKKRS